MDRFAAVSALFSIVLLQNGDALPLLTKSIRRSLFRAPTYHHDGHQQKYAISAEHVQSNGNSDEHLAADLMSAKIAEQQQAVDELQMQLLHQSIIVNNDVGPQLLGMRVMNAHHADKNLTCCLIESESESMNVFVFIYFGMVILLILFSCCYIYDFMGCCDKPLDQKKNAHFAEPYIYRTYNTVALSCSIAEISIHSAAEETSTQHIASTESHRWSCPQLLHV